MMRERRWNPRISVVVIARNEGAELRRTVENLDDTLPAGSEILVVDDWSSDRSADSLARRRGRVKLKRASAVAPSPLGVARARNFGARHTSGDVVVFADAHIRLETGWWQPLAEALQDRTTGAVAPGVTGFRWEGGGYGLKLTGPGLDIRWLRRKGDHPYAVPILPGCCLAMRRNTFEVTGGWDEGLLHRGGVDNELALRFWLLGYEQLIVPDVLVRHKFRRRSPYPVGWPEFLQNRLRLAFAHLNPVRLSKVVAAMRKYEAFGEALVLLVEGNISAWRREIMSQRVRNDDWYFEKFGLTW